jgi:hypothetical protein
MSQAPVGSDNNMTAELQAEAELRELGSAAHHPDSPTVRLGRFRNVYNLVVRHL